MKAIRLDEKQLAESIRSAPSESDAVVAVFRMVYPNFDAIEKMDGYAKCNRRTSKAICQWFMELTERLNRDRKYDKQVMPGGAWMNWGFSSDEQTELKDWWVMPAPVILKEQVPS